MTSSQKREQREQLACLFGCDESELVGQTLGDCLNDAEDYGEARIYWGCWTEEQLSETL